MILITGANGWLGLNLVQALIEGAAEIRGLKIGKARCLILPGSGSERLKKMEQSIEIVEGDLRRPRDLSNFMNGAEGKNAFFYASRIVTLQHSHKLLFSIINVNIRIRWGDDLIQNIRAM